MSNVIIKLIIITKHQKVNQKIINFVENDFLLWSWHFSLSTTSNFIDNFSCIHHYSISRAFIFVNFSNIYLKKRNNIWKKKNDFNNDAFTLVIMTMSKDLFILILIGALLTVFTTTGALVIYCIIFFLKFNLLYINLTILLAYHFCKAKISYFFIYNYI